MPQYRYTNTPNTFPGTCADIGRRVAPGHGVLGVELVSGDRFRWAVFSAEAHAKRVEIGEKPITKEELKKLSLVGRSSSIDRGGARTVKGGRRGASLGLSVVETWKRLFEQNEEISSNGGKPLTDEQISAFMRQEFPRTPERSKTPQRVKALRREYNEGAYGFERWGKPTKTSWEYDANGLRVEPGEARSKSRSQSSVAVVIDAETIRAAVRQELERQAPAKTLTIQWSLRKKTEVDLDGKHEMFPEVMKRVAAGVPILLVGPAGSGKTFLASQVAEALKLPFTFNSMSEGVSESALLGRVVPDEKGRWTYHDSPFVKSYRDGGVHLLDEIDAADPNLLVQINAAIANGLLSIPQASAEPIRRSADSIIIAAANTFGYGANREYVGRNQLDAATLNRFTMGTVEIKYDEKLELAIARSVLGDDRAALSLCDWAKSTRAKIMEHRMRRIMSTRNVEDGAKLMKCGSSLKDVQEIFFASWSADEKMKMGVTDVRA